MVEQRQVECPECGAVLRVSGEMAGGKARCSRCGASVPIPAGNPGSQTQPDVIRANRQMAGEPCAACEEHLQLGEEVVRCPRCHQISHLPCWESHSGCASCTEPLESAAAPPAPAGGTRPCPTCAELVAADANICPYCSEPIGEGRQMPPEVPREFEAKTGFLGRKWVFKLGPDRLLAERPGGKDRMQVERTNARRDITVKKRHVKLDTGDRKKKFKIGDPAWVALSSWIEGRLVSRTSDLAKQALTSAIVGIFCFQIILGPASIVQAARARREINEHPRALTGSGYAIAGMIIGIFDCLMTVMIVLAAIVSEA